MIKILDFFNSVFHLSTLCIVDTGNPAHRRSQHCMEYFSRLGNVAKLCLTCRIGDRPQVGSHWHKVFIRILSIALTVEVT